jgi:hypothetical protein
MSFTKKSIVLLWNINYLKFIVKYENREKTYR